MSSVGKMVSARLEALESYLKICLPQIIEAMRVKKANGEFFIVVTAPD